MNREERAAAWRTQAKAFFHQAKSKAQGSLCRPTLQSEHVLYGWGHDLIEARDFLDAALYCMRRARGAA